MDIADRVIWELTPEEANQQKKPFSFFGWEGEVTSAFLSISDGYWRGAELILDKMKTNIKDYDLVDTLVYPLFFNYRHSIEAYLKLLFFKYGRESEQERKKFLESGGLISKNFGRRCVLC